MKPKKLKTILLLLSFVASVNVMLAQITPQEAILQMQKGINLGNTLEPPVETGWNNPKAEEYYFDLYQEEGFQLVRIPVRWDQHTSKTSPYKVTESWMNRVEQIVDWGLERGLFIVLNSHHDDWIKQNYTETNKARFDSIWSQISNRFKDKPEKLIFEILNEPHGLSKANNDDMHTRILSIIRKTNPTRLVIFQGNEWGGSNELLTAKIPDDNYVIGSFHSYDPYLFGLEGEGKWGTPTDITQLENKFKSVSAWSEEHNIPVFLGEFGALKKCDYNSRMHHYRTYTTLIQKYKFAGAAWDDGGDFRIMERQQKEWHEVKDILLHTTANSPWPTVSVYQDSLIKLTWRNYVSNNDSIIIQRKLGTERHFKNIATLKHDTSSFYDVVPSMNKYYDYRVIAHYNQNDDLYSQPAQVFYPFWEVKTRSTFYGTPLNIPGIIEAEDFDNGGEGLAYHDADKTNIAGDYRPGEGVDIYDRLGDGYHVGNALPEEWMEYSVQVQSEGWYDVTFHLAAMFGGGTFQIKIDSLESEILTAPTCYSWLNTKPVTTKMYLKTGNKIMRFSILSDPIFNIDKMEFDFKTNADIIPNKQFAGFIAYQNNSGELVIKQNQNNQSEIFNIYTVSGALVQTVKNPESITRIPNYTLKQGVYLIQSVSKNQKQTQKIIIR